MLLNLFENVFGKIKLLIQKKGKFVGKDENENSYYESNRGKRCVIYSKTSEPTMVPPEWHIWLHYSDNTVPIGRKKRSINHIPNLTGTKNSYYPNKKVNNYYKSWNPDQ